MDRAGARRLHLAPSMAATGKPKLVYFVGVLQIPASRFQSAAFHIRHWALLGAGLGVGRYYGTEIPIHRANASGGPIKVNRYVC